MVLAVECGSIDALLEVDPGALDDEELKALLRAFGSARSRFEAGEAAAIAQLHHRCAYVSDGALSAAGWLAHHTGLSRKVAGSRVLLAKRLRRIPLMADAFAAGRVSDQHVRSLLRCVTPRTWAALAGDEPGLMAQAEALEADEFDLVVTQWLMVNDPDGPEPGGGRDSELRANRHFEGRVRIDADLSVEHGAEFLAELEYLADKLWRADQAADDSDPLKGRSRAQRNAAAAVEMARRSSTTHRAQDQDDSGDDRGDDTGDDPGDDLDGPAPRRPQLIVTVDLPSLVGDPAAMARLEDGSILPRSVLERWACDSAIGRVVMNGPSAVFDLGRTSYTPSAAQRRALIARDKRCVVPGCGRKARWCDAHHVIHWIHGGQTDLSNLVLLCRRHHKQVHHGIIRIEPADDHWHILRADGTPLHIRPPPAIAA